MKQVGKTNKNFDLDLQYGEEGERLVLSLLNGAKKIEVKTDRMAHSTGNIAVEFRYNGLRSGISTTEADYWAFVLLGGKVIILIEVEKLRVLARRAYKNGRTVMGGDNNSSEMVLVSTSDLFKNQEFIL